MMLAPPRDAEEGLVRLDPDLEEIATFIRESSLSAREKERLATMLAGYFTGLAEAHRRPQLTLVHGASREPAGRPTAERVAANCTPIRQHEHR
jgi:hypothetical protein